MRVMLVSALAALAACDQSAPVGGIGDARPDRGASHGAGWAVAAGGPGADHAVMAIDHRRRELVLAGSFVGAASFDSITMTSTGAAGLFIARLDAAGRFLWGLPIQANSTTEVRLAVDDEGNAFLAAGGVSGSASVGSIRCAAAGAADLLVVKVDRAGMPIWMKALGGAGSSMPFAQEVDVDGAGGAVLAGTFQGDPDLGGVRLHASGQSDIYVARVQADGSTDWAVQAGGAGQDQCGAVAAGSVITIAGRLGEGEARFGDLRRSIKDDRQVFVAELSMTGSWRWADASLGVAPVRGWIDALARDERGDIYVAGALAEPLVPLVMKVGSEGGLRWPTVFRGAGSAKGDGARDLLIGRGGLTVTGWFSAPREVDGKFFTPAGEDVFVASLSTDGKLQSLKLEGGAGRERGYSVDQDEQGATYVAGTYSEAVTLAGTRLPPRGDTDIFVWKIPPPEP